jgi:hypothetical protein
MAVKAAKKKAGKKHRAVPGEGLHHIEIDSAGNATVTTTPANPGGFTQVRFTTNRRDSAIVYTRKSPFAEMQVGQPFVLGLSAGPFQCIRAGGSKQHFDCGHIHDNNQFSPWGNMGGGDTPVDPNVPK